MEAPEPLRIGWGAQGRGEDAGQAREEIGLALGGVAGFTGVEAVGHRTLE